MKPSRALRLPSSAASLPPLPTSFGRYHVLTPPPDPLSSFSAPLSVPACITPPHYVPRDFWSTHTGGSALSSWKGKTPEGGPVPRGGEEERKLRNAASLAKEALAMAGGLVQTGVTTSEIDRLVHDFIVSRGAYPSPLGYSSFPRSICTSINNIIAHGIPDARPLDAHDLINIDITVFLDGYHGDNSVTFLLPSADEQARELVEATREAMEAGIAVCGPGVPVKEIGRAIEDFADRHGFVVSPLFDGHGISTTFHHPPWIQHTRNDSQAIMRAGDSFTVEPSLEQDGPGAGGGQMWDDGWTVVTAGGGRSAQFEHQVLITEDGVDVLTR